VNQRQTGPNHWKNEAELHYPHSQRRYHQRTYIAGICRLTFIMNVIRSAEALAAEERKKQLERKEKVPQINFYHSYPSVELTLDEFEVFALKRLKVRALA
jgi:predicted GIY-YIG superfamily endonuclease